MAMLKLILDRSQHFLCRPMSQHYIPRKVRREGSQKELKLKTQRMIPGLEFGDKILYFPVFCEEGSDCLEF